MVFQFPKLMETQLARKDEYHGFQGIGSFTSFLIKMWGVALWESFRKEWEKRSIEHSTQLTPLHGGTLVSSKDFINGKACLSFT